MKRSEMLEQIQLELSEILDAYVVKVQNYKVEDFLKSKASGILDMIEGFGMLPPDQNAEMPPPCACIFEWSPENE